MDNAKAVHQQTSLRHLSKALCGVRTAIQGPEDFKLDVETLDTRANGKHRLCNVELVLIVSYFQKLSLRWKWSMEGLICRVRQSCETRFFR
jgi:hypothetical protein